MIGQCEGSKSLGESYTFNNNVVYGYIIKSVDNNTKLFI